MKAMPVKLINGQWVEVSKEEATHVKLKFPLAHVYKDWVYDGKPERSFPLLYRTIPIQLRGTRSDTGNWSWNGDTEKPTLKPSILTQTKYGEDQELFRCHSFVNDGEVQFLSDCSHELVGQTCDLLEVEV